MEETMMKPVLHVLTATPDIIAIAESPSVMERFEITKGEHVNKSADIVYCQTYVNKKIIGRLENIRLPYVIHMGGDVWYELSRLGGNSKLSRITEILKRAVMVVANSATLRDIIELHIGSGNVTSLPGGLWGTSHTRHGIMPQRFIRKTEYRMGVHPLVTMNISMMVEKKYKGIYRLMEAGHKVFKKYKCMIVCTGKVDTKHVPILSQQYKINFVGYLENWPSMLHNADLFVHPSLFDCFPRAVGDAMSTALPSVVFDCAGSSEITRSAMMVDPFDDSGIADALDALLSSEKRRKTMGDALYAEAHRKTHEHHNDYRNIFSELYNSIVEKRQWRDTWSPAGQGSSART